MAWMRLRRHSSARLSLSARFSPARTPRSSRSAVPSGSRGKISSMRYSIGSVNRPASASPTPSAASAATSGRPRLRPPLRPPPPPPPRPPASSSSSPKCSPSSSSASSSSSTRQCPTPPAARLPLLLLLLLASAKVATAAFSERPSAARKDDPRFAFGTSASATFPRSPVKVEPGKRRGVAMKASCASRNRATRPVPRAIVSRACTPEATERPSAGAGGGGSAGLARARGGSLPGDPLLAPTPSPWHAPSAAVAAAVAAASAAASTSCRWTRRSSNFFRKSGSIPCSRPPGPRTGGGPHPTACAGSGAGTGDSARPGGAAPPCARHTAGARGRP
mmetsp:Transcript_181362/g.575624  ORF Transcript_181362/g.575624 Transcript_181362/m.575624 type:complete len:334 (+) Transcript_181362:234-1235(+)